MTIKPILALGSFTAMSLALADVSTVIPDISTYEHLGLESALIIGIAVLWKTLIKKDDALLGMMKTVTDALANASNSNVELRMANKTLVDTVTALQRSFERMQAQHE